MSDRAKYLLPACSLAFLAAVALAAPQPAEQPKAEPLPQGALARIGNPRLRHHGTTPNLPGSVINVAFAPDGKTLASVGGVDMKVRLWDAATGKQRHLIRGDYPQFKHVLLRPDGRLIAEDDRDSLSLREPATGEVLRRFALTPPERKEYPDLLDVALSLDGKTLTALTRLNRGDGSEPIRVRAWDVSTGKERVDRSSRSAYTALADDGRMVIETAENALTLMDTTSGRLLLTLSVPQPRGEEQTYGRPTLSRDRRLFAAAIRMGSDPSRKDAADDEVCVWDLISGREAIRLPTGFVAAMALSPDGLTLATAGGYPDPDFRQKDADTSIRLWDLTTGEELLRLQHHGTSAASLAFARDGKTLAAGMRDTTALLWDVSGSLRHTRQPANDLRPRDFDRLWSDLAGDDVKRARSAVRALVVSATQTVPLLNDRLRPAADVLAGRVRRLLAELDSDTFATRQGARTELEQLGTQAEPTLREALAGKLSAEVRKQVETLLAAPALLVRSSEVRRSLRAIEALERIGSPEARQVLRRLADGAELARQTQAARETLHRLEERSAKP